MCPALPLRPLARAAALAGALALTALPRPGAAGEILLSSEDLRQAAEGLWIAVGLDLPAPNQDLPLVGDNVPRGTATLLHRAGAAGGINGFAGLLYDNRDRDHSSLPAASYPRLARLRYSDDLKEAGVDYGLAGSFLYPAVVFGNSSTAVTAGPFARSLPRLAMTTEDGPLASARLYFNNHLYAYPEHRDFDAVDRYPANWPYTVISRGSSGSDRAFLQAISATLAAFPADTFAAMREARLVAPTLQMILRRNMAPVRSWEDYVTGAAHPPVFRGGEVSAGRMIAQANAMRPADIPPVVRLAIENETFRRAAGLAGRSERFFDTPAAIARIWRAPVGVQEMLVSTAQTEDPFGRPLTFSWHLLRGDPARVRIAPLPPDGHRARIEVAWHDPWTERTELEDGPGDRQLSRVDIAVFARAGGAETLSAPSLISIGFPAHQRRVYGDGPEGPLLLSVDYDALARDVAYDPTLHWSAPWTDTARRDAAGTLTGWSRRHADGREEEVALEEGPYTIDTSDPARPVLRAEPASEATSPVPD